MAPEVEAHLNMLRPGLIRMAVSAGIEAPTEEHLVAAIEAMEKCRSEGRLPPPRDEVIEAMRAITGRA